MCCIDYPKQVFLGLIFLLVFPFFSRADDEKKIPYESGYYYTIQKGDTLWDLSDRFYDAPQNWPDLWQKNKQIPNPHWIYPGDRIRLYRKAGVAESEGEATPAEQPEIGAKQAPSTSGGKKPYFHYSSMNHLGFVKEKAVEPSGVLFKVNDDKALISGNDIVYIKKKKANAFTPGSRFTVYRTHPTGNDIRTTDYRGVQHYFSGLVEIIRDEPQYAVAVVVDTYRSIQINDLLIPFEKRSPNVMLLDSKKDLSGKIICSEERLLVFGDQSIAFIDKGTRDGVSPGQAYSIYYKEKARLDLKDREDTPLIPLEFASLLVLLAEESTATVIITNAERSVSPGARFHVVQR